MVLFVYCWVCRCWDEGLGVVIRLGSGIGKAKEQTTKNRQTKGVKQERHIDRGRKGGGREDCNNHIANCVSYFLVLSAHSAL